VTDKELSRMIDVLIPFPAGRSCFRARDPAWRTPVRVHQRLRPRELWPKQPPATVLMQDGSDGLPVPFLICTACPGALDSLVGRAFPKGADRERQHQLPVSRSRLASPRDPRGDVEHARGAGRAVVAPPTPNPAETAASARPQPPKPKP
jgi:hypothetical protein